MDQATEAADEPVVSGGGGESPARAVTIGHVLCEACQIEVREEDWDRHQSGTAHLMSKDSPIQPLDRLKLGHVSFSLRRGK